MDSHRWQRVEQVFFAVLDRPLDERAAVIAELCADDPQLLAEVERLLAADRTMASDGFLAAVPRTMPVAGASIGEAHALGERIGRYVVQRTIGEGGMGTVLLASRAEDFEQQVAIKVLHRGLHVEAFAARFRDELRILAALAEHPNIASLYDAGTCDDGRPYFVMEYIAGQRIDRYCDARQLTTRQRIELFRQVCAAVEFAHRHTVIHRDLKPSNILVDEQGTPKLIDFGIAKIVGDGLGDLSTSETRQVTEHLALTPDYASPEQFRGEQVSTASDVYSLGVVLYELLTGRRPYSIATRTPLDMQRAVCEVEPEPPSTAVLRDTRGDRVDSADGSTAPATDATADSRRIADARKTLPARLRRQLAGDLDNIVLKALRKEPQRRYATVEQLSEDLRRHLAGLPVSARRDSVVYRAKKFLVRNWIAVAAAVVLVAALAGGVIGTTRGMFAAREANEKSRRSLSQAIEAVRRMLSRVGSDRLASVPQAGPVRREILQDAQQFCEAFVAQHADDPAARLELGRVSYLLGVIERDLGDQQASRAAFDRAIAVFEELVASSDTASGESLDAALEELALSCYHGSTQRRDVGELEACKRLLHRAIAIQSQRHSENRDDPTRLEDLVNSLNNLAVVEVDLGEVDAAKAALDEVMRRIPPLENSEVPRHREAAAYAYNNLGFLLRRLQRFDDAQRAYETGRSLRKQLADAFPDEPSYRKELAFSYNNLGVLHGDRGNDDKAAEEFAEAVRLQRRLASDFPSQPVYRQELARSLLNLGVTLRDRRYLDDSDTVLDEAAAMQRALAANHPDVPGYREELARSLCEIAVNASHQGDTDRIDAALAEATAVDKKNPRVRMLLGRSHAMSGRWQAAVDAFTAALAANPDDHETLDRRGAAYRRLDRFDAALADFTKAIELSPDDASYHRHRGSVLRDMGRLREAIAEYDRAIALQSDYETAYNSRALAYIELGELEEAIADFTQSLAVVPNDAVVLYNRGRTYASMEDWPAAIDDFEAAFEQDDNDLGARTELAIAQLAGGDGDGYRRTCARLLEAAAVREDAAARCVWPIVFAADAGVDYEACVAAARRALADSAQEPTHATSRQRAILGAALLRSGELEQAGEQLKLALSQWPQTATQPQHSPTKADVLRLAALVARGENRPGEAATFATQAAAAEQSEQAAAQLDRGAHVKSWHVRAMSAHLRRECEARGKPRGD